MFVAAVFTGSGLCAYGVSNSVEDRGMISLNLADGLSDLLVNVIYRDSEGFTWFGTESGVDRYDGYKVRTYPIKADDLRSKRVFDITEGKNGMIFVGTNQGLYSISPLKTELTRIALDKLDFSVNAIKSDGEGNLYVGSRHGLFIYRESDGKLNQRLLVNDNTSPENDVIGLAMGKDKKTLWVLTRHNLWQFVLPTNSLTRFPIPVPTDATKFLLAGNLIYIGTDGEGVIPFDISKGQFEGNLVPGNGIVTSMALNPDGRLVISTDGEGIFVYDTKDRREIERITASDDSRIRLRSNSVYSIMVDQSGMLWVGYYQSGVDYTPKMSESMVSFVDPNYPRGSGLTIRALTEYGNYTAVGTHNGFLLRDKTTGVVREYAKPVIDSDLIFTILYNDGEFLFGTYHGGMYRLNPATGAIAKFAPSSLSNKSVFKIETDAEGHLWVAASDGVYRFDNGSERPSIILNSSNSQLPIGSVYEIFFDSTGRGWFCTENGMALWDGRQVRTSGFPKGFIDRMKVRHIYETKDHRLYFIPDRGDIWQSDLSLTHFGKLEQASRNQFTAALFVIEDDDGWLWIGTDNGLFRYDRKDTFMKAGNLTAGQTKSFTHATPFKADNGDLWFGTTSGLIHLDFDKFKEESKAEMYPHLAITDVHSNGNDIFFRLGESDGKSRIRLLADENDISIRLSDFHYGLPDHYELEIMLEGVDEDWKKIDASLDIQYYDIKPGKHLLRIREPGRPDSEIALEIVKTRKVNWLLIALIAVIVLLSTGGAAAFWWLRKRSRNADISLAAADAGSETRMSGNVDDNVAYRTARLSDEECRRLFRKLETVMKKDRPYTNPDLKSKDLALMIDSSAHALSFLFNQYLHKSYYDYINEYRVDEFKQLVKETDISKYTLTTLAERCGFSSRASFFRHFKSITGLTPAEYLKNEGIG